MYQNITIEKLISIQQYHKFNYSIRKTAKEVNQSKTSIHRIYKMLVGGLIPLEIYENTCKNKKKSGRKLKVVNEAHLKIINYLVNLEHYSPDIISNIIRTVDKSFVCSKTLYNMFNSFRQNLDKFNLLRKGKNKPHNKTENRGKVSNRRTIADRNIEVPNIKETKEFGHLEGDTIVGKDHKSSIITLADIWSKTSIPLVTNSQKSNEVLQNIVNFILSKPTGTIKTITFDCGKEFSKWREFEELCNIKVYFADPGCPGQRGLNENNNGILRRSLPKGSDLSIYTQEDLNKIALKINSMPRKSLNYKSSLDLIQII